MNTTLTLSLTALALPWLASSALAAQEGVTLYQGFAGTTTVLVDETGSVIQSWPGTSTPGLSVYLDEAGELVRSQQRTTGVAGAGGGIQRLTWDGTLLWDFEMFDPNLIPHHDIVVLPNGNVLMLAYEIVGGTAAIANGRNPATVGPNFMPDKIMEIQQTGPTTGTVVWEWRAWDHLVQDFDPMLPGFGVVADNPNKIDVNFPGVHPNDWLHVNGLAYNEALDQIALSVPHFDEFWVIDHSTTTAEAAGSTGGARGKGGDLLYRWGNPQAYKRGTEADRRLFFNHDISWIESGRPGAGNFLIFNNRKVGPLGSFSAVEEIVPAIDAMGNYLDPGVGPFTPADPVWTYDDPGNFFSQIMSGAERLLSGNTLICEAITGRMFEVTNAGAIVWTHINPAQGLNWVFKARRYPETITGEEYCYGDGGTAAGCTACPCSNNAAPDSRGGCLNAAGSSARLVAAGLPSASADTLRFSLEGGNPGTFALLMSGDNRLPANATNPCFGLDSGVTASNLDGLRCIAANTTRNGTRSIDANGEVGTTTQGWGAPSDSLLGLGGYVAGQSRQFQVFYREDLGTGCGTGINTSNGMGLVMLP